MAPGRQVVIYDDMAGNYAARLWWMLRWLGHERAAILDGGFPLWVREGRPVTKAVPAPRKGSFVPRPRLGDVVDVHFVGRFSRSPDVKLVADSDQIEQLLINVVRNAVDASLETGGKVSIGWKRLGDWFELNVEDEGKGLPDTSNLFVPFFTTKPSGSGIGLALSRQIAEAHGGTISLENRVSAPGCRATLRLPMMQ